MVRKVHKIAYVVLQENKKCLGVIILLSIIEEKDIFEEVLVTNSNDELEGRKINALLVLLDHFKVQEKVIKEGALLKFQKINDTSWKVLYCNL